MKIRICIFAMILLFVVSSIALADTIIFSEDEPDKQFVIPVDVIFDKDWLLSQIEDSSSDSYNELIVALYIMNSIQYGPNENYEEISDSELTIDGLCKWLDLMSFAQSEETADGVRLIVSDNIQIDVMAKEGVIDRIDLVIKNIVNGCGNELTITVVK